jgi:hypothetical protein
MLILSPHFSRELERRKNTVGEQSRQLIIHSSWHFVYQVVVYSIWRGASHTMNMTRLGTRDSHYFGSYYSGKEFKIYIYMYHLDNTYYVWTSATDTSRHSFSHTHTQDSNLDVRDEMDHLLLDTWDFRNDVKTILTYSICNILFNRLFLCDDSNREGGQKRASSHRSIHSRSIKNGRFASRSNAALSKNFLVTMI